MFSSVQYFSGLPFSLIVPLVAVWSTVACGNDLARPAVSTGVDASSMAGTSTGTGGAAGGKDGDGSGPGAGGTPGGQGGQGGNGAGGSQQRDGSTPPSEGGSGGNTGFPDSGRDERTAECTPGVGTTDIDGDTVRDNKTCLVWQKTVHATGMLWPEENHYCDTLIQAGYDDWRMPTWEELYTWPIAGPSGGSLLTAPRYVGSNWTDMQKNTDYHVCMRTFYGQEGCGWQGYANTYGTVCVRGVGTGLPSLGQSCSGCAQHLSAYGCQPGANGQSECFVPWN